MGRRIGTIACVTISIFLAAQAFGGIIQKYWEFSKPIRIIDESRKAIAIPLDQEVYNSAKSDLSDLRVIGPQGEEYPYAVLIREEVKKEQKLRSKVISKNVTQTESVIAAELMEPLKPFNRVKVEPESNNFFRKITIEGSNDNRTWSTLRKDIVIYSLAFEMREKYFEHYTSEIYEGYGFGRYSEESLSVQFPEARYRFVRVRVPHDQDKEPVELRGVEAFHTVRTNAEEDTFKGTVTKTQAHAESKSVENIVDFGVKNAPLSRIDLATGQSNFFRKVEVEGSNDAKEWARLAHSVIFSISVDNETEENLSVSFKEAKVRYTKIRVFNGDNRPITLASVTGRGLKRLLVIIPEKATSYQLLYGNPAAKTVSYDLGDVIRGKAADSFGKGALGNQIRNDKYEPFKERRPWTEDKPYILWITMGIIGVGLIFLGSRVIKKMDK